MGKAIIYLIIGILLIVSVSAINFQWLYNPYTARLDRSLSLNQSGNEMVMDNLTVGNLTIGGVDVTPGDYIKNGTDATIVNLNITNDVRLIADVNISPYFWLVDSPQTHFQVVNKDYVDDATSSTAFDFFFNTNASDLPGHFNMTERDLEGPEVTLDSASLPAGSTTTIFNWTTLVNQPEFNQLRNGVYDVHIHLNKNLFGARGVVITPRLYNISGDGSKQDLMITFESTTPLTTAITEYDLHGVLSDPIMIGDDTRLSIQFEAVVSGGGSSPVVTVTLEGTTDSHLSIQTSTNAFEKIFIRRDGDVPLTDNWPTGNFEITGMKEIRLVNDKINLSSSGDVNATKFYGDGSALTGIISLDGLWKLSNFTEAFNAIYNISDSSLLYNDTDVYFSNVGIGTATPQYLLQTDDGTLGAAVNLSGVLYVNDSSGNVGIGTDSPYSGLHYQGDIFYLTPAAGADSNDNITIKNYATGNGAPNIILRTADIDGAYGIGVGTLSLIGGSKTTLYGGIGGGGGEISLQGGQGRNAAHNPSGYAPIVLQANGGNVGIGTNYSPDRLFEIYGDASVFRFRDSGATVDATTAFIEFGGTDEGSWNRTGYIGDGQSANKDLLLVAEAGDLRLGDSSSEYVLTLSGGDATFTGNVGIGTLNPDQKLEVIGNVNITTGNITITPDPGYSKQIPGIIWHNGSHLFIG